MFKILSEYIPDKNTVWLLQEIVESFRSTKSGIGLPLGNLTSQLFVNIYMNKFDQFAKHKIKAKYYIRYADDFVFLSEDKKWLENEIPIIRRFLKEELQLELHPDKVFIKMLSSGLDFLGMVSFLDHRVLRIKTKRRMFKKIKKRKDNLENGLISEESFKQSLQSYFGLLKYCRGYKVFKQIIKIIQR